MGAALTEGLDWRIMRFSLAIVCSLLVVMALVAGGCGPSPETSARLGQEFSLAIGQKAHIEGEELQVEFLEVTTDSRCPKNVTCIWAGEVKCLVEITYFKSLHRVTLTEPGLTDEPPRQTFKEYELAFHVDPYPESGKEISEGDYRLRITVNKG